MTTSLKGKDILATSEWDQKRARPSYRLGV